MQDSQSLAAARERLARVNIVGTSGSGKSTFSRALAARLGYPQIEMDRLFWKPKWQESPDPEFFAKVEVALATPHWVLDGNYTRTAHLKWKEVTAVVWLDYSFARTLAQALKRALSRAITRKEFWPGTGNRESFYRSFFTRQSILLWTIQTHGKNRERYAAMMADSRFAHIRWLRLRSPAEARALLASLGQK